MGNATGNHEEWRCVAGYEGRYEVSNLGRVRGVRRGKVLSAHPDGSGYFHVVLIRNGARRNCRVHRLVAEAFLGAPPPGMQVNHKDGRKDHNALDNLEYMTAAENSRHSVQVLHRQAAHGSRHYLAKLTEDKVRQIRLRWRLGGTTVRALSAEFGVSEGVMGKVIRGTAWKHVV